MARRHGRLPKDERTGARHTQAPGTHGRRAREHLLLHHASASCAQVSPLPAARRAYCAAAARLRSEWYRGWNLGKRTCRLPSGGAAPGVWYLSVSVPPARAPYTSSPRFALLGAHASARWPSTAGPGARSRFGWSRAAARPGVQTTRPSWPHPRASRCSGPKRALRRGRAGAARRPGCRCRCVEQRNAQDSPEGVARGVAEPCLAPRPDPAWRRRASPLPSLMSWPTVSTCSSKGVAAYSLLGWYWLAPQHGTYLLRAGRSGGAGRRAACGRHVGACHPAPIGLKTDLSGQCS